MSMVRFWRMLPAYTAAVSVLGWTSLLPANILFDIVPVGDSTVSQGRAVTPDGKFVVGYGDGSPNLPNGFIWDARNGSRGVIDTGGSVGKELVGVGYRTYNSNKEIVAFGTSTAGPYPSYYITQEADAANGNEVWDPKLRRTGEERSFPVSNGLAGTTTDVWYDTYTKASNQDPRGDVFLIVEQGSGAPALPASQDQKNVPSATSDARLQGISSTGLAVGWREVDDVRRNYFGQFDGDGGLNVYWANGLRANAGNDENRDGSLWAVAANSTATNNRAGGMSPVDDGRGGNWPFVVDDFNGVDQNGTATELPTFGDTAGSTTNGIVYGLSPDGNYAVGQNYRGTEKAVLWDLRDEDPNNWTITDLTELASDNGILGDFDRLARGYAVGVRDDGRVIVTGVGAYVDGNATTTRGYVFDVLLDGKLGDMDGDGDVDFDDISAFVLGLSNPAQYEADFGVLATRMGDLDGDGDLDFDDIPLFVALLAGGRASSGLNAVPEPSTALLAALGLVGLASCRWRRKFNLRR